MHRCMFRAIGFLIVLWGLAHFFTGSFVALDTTVTAVLKAIEVAAISTQNHIQ